MCGARDDDSTPPLAETADVTEDENVPPEETRPLDWHEAWDMPIESDPT